jgi:hypothetical protein
MMQDAAKKYRLYEEPTKKIRVGCGTHEPDPREYIVTFMSLGAFSVLKLALCATAKSSRHSL